MSLDVRNLSVLDGGKPVVTNVNLSVAPGEVTTILGANGAGKSELVLAVGGVLPVIGGTVLVDGEEMTNKGPDVIRRAGVAVVPEGHHVLSKLSVDDNLRAAGSMLVSGAAEALSDTYALFPELAERKDQIAGTLSGGQQQMVALGHALMSRPKYILIDEMSLGLAPLIVKRLMGVVQNLKSRGVGIILIEQFTDLALEIADHAVVLRGGKQHFSGTPETLKQQPELLDAAYFTPDTENAVGNKESDMTKPQKTKTFVTEHFSSERWNDFPWRDDDIVVATGIKTGTTWTLRIVGLLIHQDMTRVDEQIMHAPWPGVNFMGTVEEMHEEIAAIEHRRFFKSHLPLDAMHYHEKAKYINVVRHPLDTFRSMLHHWGGITDDLMDIFAKAGYPNFPRRSDSGSVKEIWGRWITEGRMDWEEDGWPFHSGIHIAQSFWEHRDLDNILLLHYSNMIEDLEREVRRIADFLEVDVSEDMLQEIVHLATFDKMKSQNKAMNPHYDFIFSHGGDGFMARGGNNTWLELLDEDDLKLYEKRVSQLDPAFLQWLEQGKLDQ